MGHFTNNLFLYMGLFDAPKLAKNLLDKYSECLIDKYMRTYEKAQNNVLFFFYNNYQSTYLMKLFF